MLDDQPPRLVRIGTNELGGIQVPPPNHRAVPVGIGQYVENPITMPVQSKPRHRFVGEDTRRVVARDLADRVVGRADAASDQAGRDSYDPSGSTPLNDVAITPRRNLRPQRFSDAHQLETFA